MKMLLVLLEFTKDTASLNIDAQPRNLISLPKLACHNILRKKKKAHTSQRLLCFIPRERDFKLLFWNEWKSERFRWSQSQSILLLHPEVLLRGYYNLFYLDCFIWNQLFPLPLWLTQWNLSPVPLLTSLTLLARTIAGILFFQSMP